MYFQSQLVPSWLPVRHPGLNDANGMPTRRQVVGTHLPLPLPAASCALLPPALAARPPGPGHSSAS